MMIIWGSRGITSTLESKSFQCPQCNAVRDARLRQVRNFFTLYFIPLIPLNVAGRYVECGGCGGTFGEEMLDYDPEVEREKTNLQLLRVMIWAAMADGHVDEGERAEIRRQYEEFAGLPIPSEKLQTEIDTAAKADYSLNAYVADIVSELSPHGKAMVVKLAFHTMSASGDLKPGHQSELTKLATTLGIPDDQYRELISQLSEMPS